MIDGDDKRSRALLAILIGLEYPELKEQFGEHVKAGHIQKSSTRLRGKIKYLNEINCHAILLEKQPRPKQWKNEKMM